MNHLNQDRVSGETLRRRILLRLQNGAAQIRAVRAKRRLLFCYAAAAALIWLAARCSVSGPLASPVQGLYDAAAPIIFLFGLLLLLYRLGAPHGAPAVGNGLLRAGLVNHAGEAPFLLRRFQDPENPRLEVLEFDTAGIPRAQWEEKQPFIEAALNIHIAQYRSGEDNSRLRLYAVPASGGLPACVPWKPDFLPDGGGFPLAMGMGLAGPVAVDLAAIPHLLIGGATGSGKSVLVRCLLYQARRKGAQVLIADFKGGVDFSDAFWQDQCHLILDEAALLDALSNLVDTLHIRKQLLVNAHCKNIDEYNRASAVPLQRIVFACDEVAELLDKSGRNKEGRETADKIIGCLATIARLGRAFGIHLVLATQRPDAAIIPGQIKNNVAGRACGAADNVLSQIILDNTDAAVQIPKEAHGRFLLHDGTLFQGFWFTL